jgi:membrane protease YdiL (CAAX protease family)
LARAAGQGALGLLWGAGIQLAAATVLSALGMLSLAPASGAGLTEAILAAAGRLCLISIVQELVFRGWLLRILVPGAGFWGAALLAGAAFVAIHVGHPGETPAGLAGLFVFALLTAAGVRRSGTVWWAAGFHSAWNLTQDLVLGLPDGGERAGLRLLAAQVEGPAWLTGGDTGPEGGLAAQLLLVAALVWLARSSAVPR